MAAPGIITIRGNLTAQRRRESIRDLADGSASAPSLAFASEQNTGAYWDSGFVVATQGVEAFRIRNIDGQLVADDAWGLANVNAANVSSTNFSWTGANLSLGSDLNVGGNLRVAGQTFTVIGAETVSNALSVTNAGTGPALRIRQNGAQAIMEAYDDANLAFKIHDGGNVSVGVSSTVPSTTFAVLGTSFANSVSSNELRVVDGAGTSNVFDVSTSGLVTLHNKLDVMSGVDGGSSRGLAMWQAGDLSWGVYVASSGSGKSFAGGSAIAGADFSSHAMRFRAYNATTSGFIWENALESRLMSLNSGTGNLSVVGAVSAANISVAGNVSASNVIADGHIIGNLSGTSAMLTGNVSAGNVATTGNVSGAYIFGNGSGLTNLPAAATGGSVGSYSGTLATSALGNTTVHRLLTSGTLTITGTGYLRADVCVVSAGGSGVSAAPGYAFYDGGGGAGGSVVKESVMFSPGTYVCVVGSGQSASSISGNVSVYAPGPTGPGTGGSNYYGTQIQPGGASPFVFSGGYENAGGGGGGGGTCAAGTNGFMDAYGGRYGGTGGRGTSFLTYVFGGGGGGGGASGGSGGGLGGGGNGGNAAGAAGTANTGGGGGGGGPNSPYSGGAGGSGVIVIHISG
jgi:hypothetical protein